MGFFSLSYKCCPIDARYTIVGSWKIILSPFLLKTILLNHAGTFFCSVSYTQNRYIQCFSLILVTWDLTTFELYSSQYDQPNWSFYNHKSLAFCGCEGWVDMTEPEASFLRSLGVNLVPEVLIKECHICSETLPQSSFISTKGEFLTHLSTTQSHDLKKFH